MPTKLLLDTDIGSDIDDAVCLAYLLAQPQCDLLGITTVTGDTVQRAAMADAMCRVAGRSIPIYPGAREPLIIPQLQPNVPQAAALERWAHTTDFPPQGVAVEFLRDAIRAHPGEVTLLAIGPLTNVALLFAVDPEIPSLLKELVLMCGMFFPREGKPPFAEWNAKLDPHASTIVYRAHPPRHRSIGLDVTLQVNLPAPEVRQRFDVPLLRPVLDFAEVWFHHRPFITFHDPLAATTIFDDSICQFSSGTVTVDMDKEPGLTSWAEGDASCPHQVATTVDAEGFFKHYFSAFA
jgi:purine nucleosidase